MAKASESNNKPESSRRKSRLLQTEVPSVPLKQALRVPQAIADDLAKQPSPPLQVAKAMGIKPSTGDFRMLCGAAIAFGLTEGGYNAESIRLTDLGRAIVAPVEEGQDDAARREAVLRPRINREFLTRYNRNKWPRDDIARNVVETLGVPADQSERAIARIRQDAEAVGFIMEINGDFYIDMEAPAGTTDSAPTSTAPQDGASERSDEAPVGASMQQPSAEAPAEAPSSLPAVQAMPNRRVFITHGKDTSIVQQIKEILRFGDFEPVVAVENQTPAKPVPDKVMDDMRSCTAGIVHVGPEMKLLDPDGNEHQMLNPNVLIEIGAAMALYNRRFILLVEVGTTIPSNLQGLYQVRYRGSGLDHEATMNLLKAFNAFKDDPAG